MSNYTPATSILFLDIETAPAAPGYDKLPEHWQELWNLKAEQIKRERNLPEASAAEVYDRAGIYAEFGKVVCIVAGAVVKAEDGRRALRLKAFAGHDEKKLLSDFAELLRNRYSRPGTFLCAHNGKEFDFPFLGRRMLVHGITLPPALDVAGKKPWETSFIDTMELWKFGDRKSFTSLNVLAALFGIPSPKDDIDGSMIHQVYWQENDLERIARYCGKDVATLAQVYLRITGEEIIDADLIMEIG
ncbi:MAG: 3'-5' exonuclease [Bacteroidetes bacterium]|nr:3'-5' exonuclease [Bacteroidota bacterium]